MDLRDVTMEQAHYVMDRLNNRPRSRGGKTPNEFWLQVDYLRQHEIALGCF